MTTRVGVLLNSIAGFGGTLAMHGTDRLAADRFADAVAAGRASRRLVRALETWRSRGGAARLVPAPGLLGADTLRSAGFDAHVEADRDAGIAAGGTVIGPTTRLDTLAAARRLVADGIDALLFSGGDGTATDIAEAIGLAVPVIGVPSGVKMHSQVFSRSPEAAGRLLAELTAGRAWDETADVLDAAADGSTGVIAALRAARAGEPLQGAKGGASASSDEGERRAIAAELLRASGPATTWIIGPGTTAAALADALGVAGTLRGVDVRHPSGRVEPDVDEERLLAVVTAAADPRLVLGVVGGQGFLLGRGNHELSPRVLAALGPDRVSIVATSSKVATLVPPVLYIDADDGLGGEPAGSRHPLLGYRRVRTGARQTTVLNVVDAAA
ncbi:NAD(+)/NADH kinase [Microbacterium sp. 1P10UB]|uniref:ATP-NAD kinase family protein n=1 Tax=unclassified Microbacterium TaxID=2609290 RepID=UPI00399F4355